jgi:predicted aldo/keto reductase-like oxidoreductase
MPRSTDKISSLGFGCMRFPTTAEGRIDEEKSLEMLHYAYKKGVNYYDTAWPYHNGQSETLLGTFLQQINRKKVLVATKLPCWLIKTEADFEHYLNLQLEHLQTDYIDYYLLHALNQKSWKQMKSLGVFKFIAKAKADNKIRHIGFSFHDSSKVFKNILNAYEWDFCQIMLNYLDTHYQAGFHGFELAVAKGLGVIAMEPLRGGKLINPVPENVKRLWAKDGSGQSMLQRALRWVWNLEGCQVLLSGMSSLEQVKENVKYADQYPANNLSDKDLQYYKKVRREYIKRIPVLCSECRYCLPCPAKVAIPSVIGVYNEAVMFEDKQRHRKEYDWFVPEENKADKCINCGACLPKCPHHINIPEVMKNINTYFAEEQPAATKE